MTFLAHLGQYFYTEEWNKEPICSLKSNHSSSLYVAPGMWLYIVKGKGFDSLLYDHTDTSPAYTIIQEQYIERL